jgi:hypothetical protein
MNTKSDKTEVVHPLKVLQTPFCGELRSKKFFIRDEIPTKAEDFMDSSGYIVCYHTHMAIGPDGGVVHPDVCTPERGCYRSALAKPAPYVPGPGSSTY